MDTRAGETKTENRSEAPTMLEQTDEGPCPPILASDRRTSIKLWDTMDPNKLLEAQMEYARRKLELDRQAIEAETRDIRHSSNDWPSSEKPREFISQHHASLQVSGTLIRREQDYYRKYEEQVARGRPHNSWKQCSDPQCWRLRCLYVDLVHMPICKTTYGKRRPVARRTGMFHEAMVKHLFGDLDAEAREQKGRLIESFVGSPPVRGALGLFDILCKHRRWDPTSMRLARVLTRIRHGVVYLVSTTRLEKPVADAHCFYGGEWATYPKGWTLRHLAMQFCVVAEAWRRYGLSWGAKWDFGSDEVVADFLCAILLNFHNMRRREAVLVRRYNVLRLKESWENWLDRYHVLRQEDEELECGNNESEVSTSTDCLEGFGQGATPWMSERMKKAIG